LIWPPYVPLGTSEALYAMQADPQIASALRVDGTAEMARERRAMRGRGELRPPPTTAPATALRQEGDDPDADGVQRGL